MFSLPSELTAEEGVLGPLLSGPTRPLQLSLGLGLPQPWVLCCPGFLLLAHTSKACTRREQQQLQGQWGELMAGKDGAKTSSPPPQGRGQSGFCLSEARDPGLQEGGEQPLPPARSRGPLLIYLSLDNVYPA